MPAATGARIMHGADVGVVDASSIEEHPDVVRTGTHPGDAGDASNSGFAYGWRSGDAGVGRRGGWRSGGGGARVEEELECVLSHRRHGVEIDIVGTGDAWPARRAGGRTRARAMPQDRYGVARKNDDDLGPKFVFSSTSNSGPLRWARAMRSLDSHLGGAWGVRVQIGVEMDAK
ncbi:hypothetical protein C8R44DRAFT_847296 [Mycena epipterygia]|nr:hypothetical protein C8R44DRAFT_847296 [Mycena epipterygia]